MIPLVNRTGPSPDHRTDRARPAAVAIPEPELQIAIAWARLAAARGAVRDRRVTVLRPIAF